MSGERFLLLLEDGVDRLAFISSIKPKLETMGLVIYPWSPAIDATPVSYRFKLWIDLMDAPIDAWNLRHILPMVGQFGMLLEHTPFTEVARIERLRILVAIRSLSDVPRVARLTVRGLRHLVPLRVVPDLEDKLHMLSPPSDPTPPSTYFKNLEHNLQVNPPPSQGFNRQQKKVAAVTLDFGVAFEAWRALPPSAQKDDLARKLQDSPYWPITKAQAALALISPSPVLVPASETLPEQIVTAKQIIPAIVVHTRSKGKEVATENLPLQPQSIPVRHVLSPPPNSCIFALAHCREAGRSTPSATYPAPCNPNPCHRQSSACGELPREGPASHAHCPTCTCAGHAPCQTTLSPLVTHPPSTCPYTLSNGSMQPLSSTCCIWETDPTCLGFFCSGLSMCRRSLSASGAHPFSLSPSAHGVHHSSLSLSVHGAHGYPLSPPAR